MKNKLCYILIFIVIASTFTFTDIYATGCSIDNLLAKETLDGVDNAQTKDAVKNIIKKEDVRENVLFLNRKEFAGIKDVDDLATGSPYKVITADSELLQALIEGKPITDILAKLPYQWNVPILIKPDVLKKASLSKSDESQKLNLSDQELEQCKVGTVYTIGKFSENEKWKVTAIGGRLSAEQIDFCRKSKILSAFLKNKNINTAEFFANFEIPSLHMNLLYIKNGQQEYFIPLLHSRQELYGLKNMNLYTRDEVATAISSQIKQDFEMMSSGIGG